MKSQIPCNETKKISIILSDLHLSAGEYIHKRSNQLECFFYDKELCELLDYYSSLYAKESNNTHLELVINGDFLDFLAVPYVEFFDDEYWSNQASLEKLKLILNAHHEVFSGIRSFLSHENRSFIYVLGNHDAEMIFESCKEYLLNYISPEVKIKEKIKIIIEMDYSPMKGVILKHGHDYENPHNYSIKENLIGPYLGQYYFLPPWGSFYVSRIVNKYKVERRYVDAVRPVKKFLLHGILFDTFFTIRFLLANIYFFVRIVLFDYISIYGLYAWKNLLKALLDELDLFKDEESLIKDFFTNNPDIHTLIVGHTHRPFNKKYPDGTTFMNTGTWTQMYYLNFERSNAGHLLTYALLSSVDPTKNNIYYWKGLNNGPEVRFFSF